MYPSTSPQAILPRLNERLGIREPLILDLSDVLAHEVYNKATEPAVIKMFIHNIGLSEIKYALNQNVTAAVYHDLLASDSGAAEKGLGTKENFNFQDIAIDTVSIMSSANPGKVAIIKYYRQ